MQEQELLSTRPHLPTSAMTLWQRAGLIIYISIRGQREFSIPGILDESQLHFFSLDHEK